MRYLLPVVVLISHLPLALADIKPQWSLDLPARKPAWEHTQRMTPDSGYEPVTAGKLVFVGMETNGALIAIDAATGVEQWRFYTNAPIRWAPAVDDQRVYVGSDDGCLYCLDHAGKLMWKHRGGPREQLIIGHERMMSTWPISSRPLLLSIEQTDGAARTILFITAGYWPVDGIYSTTLDPATGDVVWSNSTAEYRPYGTHRLVEGTLYASGHNSNAAFDPRTGTLLDAKMPKGLSFSDNAPDSLPGGWRHTTDRKTWVAGNDKGITLYADGEARNAKPSLRPALAIKPAPPKHAFSSDTKEGWSLIVSLDDGSLVRSLLRDTKMHVVVVEPDAGKARAWREMFDSEGLFDDHRLSVIHGEPDKVGLPPYFASLILHEAPANVAGLRAHLHPYDGLLVEKQGAQVKRIEAKDGPKGAADWTHEFYDAANTLASRDKLVKAPLGVLWYGGPAAHGKHYFDGFIDHQSGHGLNPQPTPAMISRGRMILQSQGLLTAVDIYTGRIVWETQIPRMYSFGGSGGGLGIHSKNHPRPWEHEEALKAEVKPAQHPRASGFDMVLADDAIYVGAAEKMLVIDPKTGRIVKSFPVPLPQSGEGDLCWGYPRLAGDLLVSTLFRPRDLIDAQAGHDGNGGDWAGDRMPMSQVIAINRHTGEYQWSRVATWGFLNRATAIGGDKVFVGDWVMEGVLDKWLDAGRKLPHQTPPYVYALDLKTGRELWKFQLDVLVKNIEYSASRDILLVPCRHVQEWADGRWESQRKAKGKGEPGRMYALRGKTGDVIYKVTDAPYHNPHIILDDLVIDRYGNAFNLLTGQPATRKNPITGLDEPWGFDKGGCNHLIACENLVTWRTAFYDLESGLGVTKLSGMDAGCSPTLIPGGGVLNIPNFGTHHKRNRMTAMALIHRPDNEHVTRYQFTKAKGPAGDPGVVRRAGYNFGGLGDRLDDDGALWLAVTQRSNAGLSFDPKQPQWFSAADDHWLASGGVQGIKEIRVPTTLNDKKGVKGQKYDVRLYFACPQGVRPGQHVFSVSIEDKPALTEFDIAKETAGGSRILMKEFKDVVVDGPLNLVFEATTGEAMVSGVELIAK